MKHFYTLIILFVGLGNLNAQDNCADAFNFTSDAQDLTQYCFDPATISTAVGTPAPTCGSPVNDAWYQFTIAGGPMDVLIEGSGYDNSGGPNARDLDFEVYSSTGPCTGLTSIGCANNNTNGGLESLTLTNLPNGTYYIRFYSDINGTIVNANLCITTTTYVPPPPNDDCINAIPVVVGTGGLCIEVTGTNTSATASAGAPAPSCGGYAGGDVWYSIVVPASGEVNFTVDFAAANSLTDADMAIYSGTCGALTEIECDDLDGTGFMPLIQATGLTAGTTIYIRIWDFANAVEGDFDLCVSEPPVTLNNQDCNTAIPICGGTSFAGASNGAGSVVDLGAANDDCLAGENQTSWVYFEISSPGSIEFTISPSNGTDDYDFALWHYPLGVGQVCPPANGTVDRCSFGAGAGLGGSYDTGLGQGAVDLSEGAAGDNWVAPLTGMNIGDVIYLVVDNFSSTTSPYTLDFTGSTAGLDCTILPSEALSFYVKNTGVNQNTLFWHTNKEENIDFFTLEHSVDGKNWSMISKSKSAGKSEGRTDYNHTHFEVRPVVNYYRISETNYNGVTSPFRIVSINNAVGKGKVVYTTNLLGQEVDENYKGVVIDVMEDGTSIKRLQH